MLLSDEEREIIVRSTNTDSVCLLGFSNVIAAMYLGNNLVLRLRKLFDDRDVDYTEAVRRSLDTWRSKWPEKASLINFVKILRDLDFNAVAVTIEEEIKKLSPVTKTEEEVMPICISENIFYTIAKIRAYFKPQIRWEILNDFYRHLDQMHYKIYENHIKHEVKLHATTTMHAERQIRVRDMIKEKQTFLERMNKAAHSALADSTFRFQDKSDIEHFAHFQTLTVGEIGKSALLEYALDVAYTRVGKVRGISS